MIKMVAIDLDDTLLDSAHRIPSGCIEAIQKVREQGIMVTLATGRMYSATLPYAQELGVDLPLITYQGALVKCALSGEVYYYKELQPQIANDIVRILEQKDIWFHFYSAEELYTRILTPGLENYCRATGVEPVLVKNMNEAVRQFKPLEIMAIFSNRKDCQRVERLLHERYEDKIHTTPFKYNSLEIMDSEATKARALEALAARFQIKRGEVMAIGDSHNDLPMIKWAGIGVAVGNAHPMVKEAADFVVASNEEEGVREALYSLLPI